MVKLVCVFKVAEYTIQNLLRISFLTMHISVLSLMIHLYEDLIIVFNKLLICHVQFALIIFNSLKSILIFITNTQK